MGKHCQPEGPTSGLPSQGWVSLVDNVNQSQDTTPRPVEVLVKTAITQALTFDIAPHLGVEHAAILHVYRDRHPLGDILSAPVLRELAIYVIHQRTEEMPVGYIERYKWMISTQGATLQQRTGHDASIDFAAAAAIENFNCHNPSI